MKSKSFLVTVYYHGDSAPEFEHPVLPFALSDAIRDVADKCDPDSDVFDVAIDFRIKRIIQVLLRKVLR